MLDGDPHAGAAHAEDLHRVWAVYQGHRSALAWRPDTLVRPDRLKPEASQTAQYGHVER